MAFVYILPLFITIVFIKDLYIHIIVYCYYSNFAAQVSD